MHNSHFIIHYSNCSNISNASNINNKIPVLFNFIELQYAVFQYPDLGGVTSYIWHSTDVRAEGPPFFNAARYMIGLLFSTKSI